MPRTSFHWVHRALLAPPGHRASQISVVSPSWPTIAAGGACGDEQGDRSGREGTQLEVQFPLRVEEVSSAGAQDLVATPQVRVTRQDVASRGDLIPHDRIQFIAEKFAAALWMSAANGRNGRGTV